MGPGERDIILEKASVPEHSVTFMSAMAGGEPFLQGPYLFIAAEDWLLAIGYPIEHEYRVEEFKTALSRALKRTRAHDCWAICPDLPAHLKSHLCEQDHYYTLKSDVAVPSRLDRLAQRAAASLNVDESTLFTSAHRRLWAEFMGRKELSANVRELYNRTETVLNNTPGLLLLNAWDCNGNLAASLLLDSAPRRFNSYLIGARSLTHYTPYASDLLFREMICRARQSGKTYLHLGLGVNNGIRRFKTKWGAVPGLPYEMAKWREKMTRQEVTHMLMQTVSSLQPEPMSREKTMARLTKQRRFAMLWEIEKDGHTSWIGGTAHFFSYSFESSFRMLFEKVDTVLFEGPLDAASLDQVTAAGFRPDLQTPRLSDSLTEAEIRNLERVVCGPQGFWASLTGLRSSDPPDVRNLLSQTRPWMGFFTLWSSFLARHGGNQSVDLEAWTVAHDMGKSVHVMETIQEQIRTLEDIHFERIVDFLRQCRRWKQYIRHYERYYLKGEIDDLFINHVEFPTRSEHVIYDRDAVFLERMRPYLERGRCAVFVGSAHMINLRGMLADAGYRIRKI